MCGICTSLETRAYHGAIGAIELHPLLPVLFTTGRPLITDTQHVYDDDVGVWLFTDIVIDWRIFYQLITATVNRGISTSLLLEKAKFRTVKSSHDHTTGHR